MTALKMWNGTSWETIPALLAPGSILNTQRIAGQNNGTKSITTNQQFTVDAAGTIPLALSYTPPVDAWLEAYFFCGQFSAATAAYALGYHQVRIAPVDVDGRGAGIASETQHSTVQTTIVRQVRRTFKLQAGIAYTFDALFSASSGTWQYYQGGDYLWLETKAWVR